MKKVLAVAVLGLMLTACGKKEESATPVADAAKAVVQKAASAATATIEKAASKATATVEQAATKANASIDKKAEEVANQADEASAAQPAN